MRGLSCCLLGLELGFMLPMYGGKKDEGAIKVHILNEALLFCYMSFKIRPSFLTLKSS